MPRGRSRSSSLGRSGTRSARTGLSRTGLLNAEPIANARTGGAAVLILDEKHNCLAISRGSDKKDWNLPGGYAEPGEEPIQVAVRELHEETGIIVTPSNLEHIYTHRDTAVFSAKDYFRWPAKLRSRPFEGYVGWQPVSTLCRPSSTFHPHARRLFAQLGLR